MRSRIFQREGEKFTNHMPNPKGVSIVSIAPMTSTIRRDILLTNIIALGLRENQWKVKTVGSCSSEKYSVI
jgi:hypothetical protein